MHQAVSGLFAFTLLLPNLENLFFSLQLATFQLRHHLKPQAGLGALDTPCPTFYLNPQYNNLPNTG